MGWISETMCFQSGGCMLIAELGARCTAHPASQTSYCEKTGPLRTLDSTFKHLITAWSTRIHTDAQLGKHNVKDTKLYLCFNVSFLPFLGSWWRSWSDHRRTLHLRPGGRSSVPLLLLCGKPEESKRSSKNIFNISRFKVVIKKHTSTTV